jgi:uncharacterized protein (TIGR02145 family)
MKKSLFTCAASALLAVAFVVSCSDSGSSNEPIKKARITGVSQKGPFVEGSKAILYELNDKFEQTGRSFTDIIADDKGSFEIKNIELASPYAMLEANGYYRNENTGNISTAPITLFAIADVREKDQVNVNILTHLEYYRVLNLAESGKTVKDAKKQAQREIFAVFGIDSDGFKDSEDMTIFGTSESDAALLAISVLLQSNLSEGEFSQRLTNFSQAVKTGGVWNNEEAKEAMAEWAAGADIGKIKNNILGWELFGEVPAFEKYAYGYRDFFYELGVCNAGSQDNVKNDYICNGNHWEPHGFFIDAREGKKYKVVFIGTQTWMAENLNYHEPGKSACAYNEPSYCEKYGRLYNWETAMSACPNGWHLPSKEEWTILIDYVGGEEIAETKLKATNGWPNNGSDEFNFSALPGGYRWNDISGKDEAVGYIGRWWTSSEYDDVFAYSWIIYEIGEVRGIIQYNQQLNSVRCIKN